MGTLYRTLVKAVLLFELETWVMSPHTRRTMGGFDPWVIFQMIGRQLRRKVDGSWVKPPLVSEMAEACLEEGETYVSLFHNTVAKFIVARPIIYMRLVGKRRPREWLFQR